jgi:hypothetical protein
MPLGILSSHMTNHRLVVDDTLDDRTKYTDARVKRAEEVRSMNSQAAVIQEAM